MNHIIKFYYIALIHIIIVVMLTILLIVLFLLIAILHVLLYALGYYKYYLALRYKQFKEFGNIDYKNPSIVLRVEYLIALFSKIPDYQGNPHFYSFDKTLNKYKSIRSLIKTIKLFLVMSVSIIIITLLYYILH